jgi:hypothetical protein
MRETFSAAISSLDGLTVLFAAHRTTARGVLSPKHKRSAEGAAAAFEANVPRCFACSAARAPAPTLLFDPARVRVARARARAGAIRVTPPLEGGTGGCAKSAPDRKRKRHIASRGAAQMRADALYRYRSPFPDHASARERVATGRLSHIASA